MDVIVRLTSKVERTPYEVVVTYKNLLTGDRNLKIGTVVTSDHVFAIADKLSVTVELAQNDVGNAVDRSNFDSKIDGVKKAYHCSY